MRSFVLGPTRRLTRAGPFGQTSKSRVAGGLVFALLTAFLAGCEALYLQPTLFSEQMAAKGKGDANGGDSEADAQRTNQRSQLTPAPDGVLKASPTRGPEMYSAGTEKFVRPTNVPKMDKPVGDGDITLNFENTSILEVVKVILGDLLQ